MTVFILVLCTFLSTSVGDGHGPCEDTHCPEDRDCKVRYMPCLRPPCPPPYSQCILKEKPGFCPRESTYIDKCVDQCDTDANCHGNFKCCGQCRRECKPPRLERVKPGQCPPISQCPDTLPYCPTTSKCNTDEDCPGTKKCCGRCPRFCIDPSSDS